MTTLLSHNFPSGVAALVSDRTIDFALGPQQIDLTGPQHEYLSARLKQKISPVLNIRQVHGDGIIEVDESWLGRQVVPEADGVVTGAKNFPIAVRTADCLPIFIFDPRQECIGLVHAGWKGSRKEIVVKTIGKMTKLWQSRPEHLIVTVGPGIRSCCYEVGAEFREFFPRDIILRENRFFLDLVSINKNQLLSGGVRAENIFESSSCTCCDRNFFSYRREGQQTGRHISVMMLQ